MNGVRGNDLDDHVGGARKRRGSDTLNLASEMGTGASIPNSIDEAYDAGYSQQEIDDYLAKNGKRRTSSFDLSGVYLAKLTPPASPKVDPLKGGLVRFEELKIDDGCGKGRPQQGNDFKEETKHDREEGTMDEEK